MTRQSCIDALVDAWGTVSDFRFESGGTVVADDQRALAGGFDRAVVVHHLRGEAVPRAFSWDWYLAADVFIRTNNKPSEARETSNRLIQTMLDTIRGNITLTSKVTEAEATETRTLTETYRAARGVYYVEQITVRVREPV